MSVMLGVEYQVNGLEPPYEDDRPAMESPEAAECYLNREHGLFEAKVEECWALLLNTRHRLERAVMISRGSIDHTFMSPREIYREALVHNAAAVILAHNHPSGDPTPSEDDLRVTRRLAAAGELMGVTMLDHIVIGSDSYRSMARIGWN